MKFNLLLILITSLSFNSLSQEFKQLNKVSFCKNQIEAKHNSTKNLQANFTETVYSDVFKEPQIGKGKIYFQKEDRIRWEHNLPSRDALLMNGKSVKYYENGKLKENIGTNTIARKVQKLMVQMLSGSFLSETDFSISYYESSSEYKLVLKPKSPRLGKYISEVQMFFNKKTIELNSMHLQDPSGEKVVYKFSEIKINTSISTSLFNQL